MNRSLTLSTVFLLLAVTLAAAPPGDPPKKETPGEFSLVNKAKDIHVVSDRDESILDYFQRNHVIIGGVGPKELSKILKAEKPLAKFFVNYASYNDDPEKASLFGA